MAAAVALIGGALATIAGVSPWLLGLALALHLLKVVAEARAWHGIVVHAHRDGDREVLPFRTTLAAFVGSIGVNAVIPARLGDAFRVGLLRRRLPGSSVPTLGATIVLETVLELMFAATVVGIVLVGGGSVGSVGFVGRSTAGLLSSPLLLGLAATVLVVVGAFAVVFRHPARDLGSRVVRGFSVVGSPRAFGGVGLWKVTAWTLRIACVFTFLLAFHMPATAWTALVVIGAQSVAGTVPLAPGNAGTQQAALALAFRGMVGAGTVVGFGVGMQASTALVDLVAGGAAVALVAGGSELRETLSASRGRRTARATAV